MSKIITTNTQFGISTTNSDNFTLGSPNDGSIAFKRGSYDNPVSTVFEIDSNHNLKLGSSTELSRQTGEYLSATTGYKNKIINGNFDIWQRGTTATISNSQAFLADRWSITTVGSSSDASRQLFTLGQTSVPYNPKYYLRNIITHSVGAGNYSKAHQRIEKVSELSGQTVTLSFWAKADASKNIAIELVQNFGTGGSPSSEVTTIGVGTIALTTSWQKFTSTISVPSVSGKTLGSNNNDYLEINFWFESGSTFNARTNTLGQQSGTFDISQVQLEKNQVATVFEKRLMGIEQKLCQRYFHSLTGIVVLGISSSTTAGRTVLFNYSVIPRINTPTITVSNITNIVGGTTISTFTTSTNDYGYYFITTTGTGFTANRSFEATLDYTINMEL
jgi:hypothetical protein